MDSWPEGTQQGIAYCRNRLLSTSPWYKDKLSCSVYFSCCPCSLLTPAVYCRLNSSAPCIQLRGILFNDFFFFKSNGISSHTAPRHLLPCSHAWSLKVLMRLKERLPLSPSLAQGKSRELLRAQGRVTSHSNTMHTYSKNACTQTHSLFHLANTHAFSHRLQTEPFAMTTCSRPCPSWLLYWYSHTCMHVHI